jgi:hypothetical protein
MKKSPSMAIGKGGRWTGEIPPPPVADAPPYMYTLVWYMPACWTGTHSGRSCTSTTMIDRRLVGDGTTKRVLTFCTLSSWQIKNWSIDRAVDKACEVGTTPEKIGTLWHVCVWNASPRRILLWGHCACLLLIKFKEILPVIKHVQELIL